mmetsp:Transcript_19001/g.44517  ORF Transcript_19001/g.44517 Transcript_19001/m.44517 type:complete len:181 (-) Transcript_19001:190-732(-)
MFCLVRGRLLRSCSINSHVRSISTKAAMSTLGMKGAFTQRQLRDAYYTAAKRCHPDLVSADDTPLDFREVTDAFEHLMKDRSMLESDGDDEELVTVSEDERFRTACREILGLSAEAVEESKRDPKFRQWLKGNTDAAHYWRNFLMGHGGLAPQLRPPAGFIGQNEKRVVRMSETRRKRKR